MTWLRYILIAKTEYNLHSPFLYRLYTEVLSARPRGLRHTLTDVCLRLERYYGGHFSADGTLTTRDGTFLLLDHPHQHPKQWQALRRNPQWQVTLDLYGVGVAVSNPRLSKQHFVLR